MKKTSLGKGAALICYLACVLAPLSWGFFTVYTRNTFHLDEFTGERLSVCLALSVVPVIFFFLARHLQRRSGAKWGDFLASAFFLLAAAAWLYTLALQWPVWNAALEVGNIARTQRTYLRAAAITGVVTSLLPLLIQIPGVLKGTKKK